MPPRLPAALPSDVLVAPGVGGSPRGGRCIPEQAPPSEGLSFSAVCESCQAAGRLALVVVSSQQVADDVLSRTKVLVMTGRECGQRLPFALLPRARPIIGLRRGRERWDLEIVFAVRHDRPYAEN